MRTFGSVSPLGMSAPPPAAPGSAGSSPVPAEVTVSTCAPTQADWQRAPHYTAPCVAPSLLAPPRLSPLSSGLCGGLSGGLDSSLTGLGWLQAMQQQQRKAPPAAAMAEQEQDDFDGARFAVDEIDGDDDDDDDVASEASSEYSTRSGALGSSSGSHCLLLAPAAAASPESLSHHELLSAWQQDPSSKPPFNYATLINMCYLDLGADKLTLSEIYAWMQGTFAFFRSNPASGWKNSIRHNLSAHDCFTKVSRCHGDEPGKGGFWALDNRFAWMFDSDGVFCSSRKRCSAADRADAPAALPVDSPLVRCTLATAVADSSAAAMATAPVSSSARAAARHSSTASAACLQRKSGSKAARRAKSAAEGGRRKALSPEPLLSDETADARNPFGHLDLGDMLSSSINCQVLVPQLHHGSPLGSPVGSPLDDAHAFTPEPAAAALDSMDMAMALHDEDSHVAAFSAAAASAVPVGSPAAEVDDCAAPWQAMFESPMHMLPVSKAEPDSGSPRMARILNRAGVVSLTSSGTFTALGSSLNGSFSSPGLSSLVGLGDSFRADFPAAESPLNVSLSGSQCLRVLQQAMQMDE